MYITNSPSHEEDFDDVGCNCNADLYLYYKLISYNMLQDKTRFRARVEVASSDERSQQQQQRDPHCFQSLSLD